MKQVVGRYAPSPTGAQHLGNLRTALLAWLQARLLGGSFLVRMEDLDTPRVVSGSDQQILDDLQWLGLDWDGPVLYQSSRRVAYEQAIENLTAEQLVYPCFCSRKELREAASAPHGKTHVYPGNCASLNDLERKDRSLKKTPALRLRVGDHKIEYLDGLLGQQNESLGADVGDFVIKRADDLHAYQLAVVVDDLEQNVSHVLRGADLSDSTGRQLYLASLLKPQREPIEYWHVPLVLDASGERMAKRDGSFSVDSWRAEGKGAADLIGKFACELDLIDCAQTLSAQELLTELSTEDLRVRLKTHQ